MSFETGYIDPESVGTLLIYISAAKNAYGRPF